MKEAKEIKEKTKNKNKNLKKKTGNVVCPKCGDSRFKTMRKGSIWKCRNCGHIEGGLTTK